VKLVNIPLASHFNLSLILFPNNKEEKYYISHIPYASEVGSLMYVMVCTRPNIDHVVGVVYRYMKNPSKEHWETVKWVSKYLRGTSSYCITYNRCSDSICGYIDSNFASDLDKRRYTSGYVFTLAGRCICWMYKLKKNCFIHY